MNSPAGNNGHDPFQHAQPDWGATGGTLVAATAERLLALQADKILARPQAAEQTTQAKLEEELGWKRRLRDEARAHAKEIESERAAGQEAWALPKTLGKRALLTTLVLLVLVVGATSMFTNRTIALELLQNSILATTLTLGLTVLPVGVEAVVRKVRVRDGWVYWGLLLLSVAGAVVLLREFGLASGGAVDDVFSASATQPSRVRLLIGALLLEISLGTVFMHLAFGLCAVPAGTLIATPEAEALTKQIQELDHDIAELQTQLGESKGKADQLERSAKSWVANNFALWKGLQRRVPMAVCALLLFSFAGCSVSQQEDAQSVLPAGDYVVGLDPRNPEAARAAMNNLLSTNFGLPMTFTVLAPDGRAVAQATIPQLVVPSRPARARCVQPAMRDIQGFLDDTQRSTTPSGGIDALALANAIKQISLGNAKPPTAVFLIGSVSRNSSSNAASGPAPLTPAATTFWLDTGRKLPEPEPAELAALTKAGFDVQLAMRDQKLFWPIVFAKSRTTNQSGVAKASATNANNLAKATLSSPSKKSVA